MDTIDTYLGVRQMTASELQTKLQGTVSYETPAINNARVVIDTPLIVEQTVKPPHKRPSGNQRRHKAHIQPHLERPYGWNAKTGASRLPALQAGASLMQPDVHPDANAYDGGRQEHDRWMHKRARYARKAAKQRTLQSTAQRQGVSFYVTSYRIGGRPA